jgi:signal transduction histidine kinase
VDQTLARREALRVFRVVLVVQLVFMALGSLAIWGLAGSAQAGLTLRLIPTLLLALLALPLWLESVVGRYFLALAVGLDVLLVSVQSAHFFYDQRPFWALWLGLPNLLARHLAETPPVEPFFFLLIPLVLLAWGYGRRGALWGSTWAALLHLGLGWASSQEGFFALRFLIGALIRITLLYLVPFIVGALAERERQQHTELEVAHQRLRRHAATVEQLAISRERNRLARDLHDTLAHSLSALSVQLEALRTLLRDDLAAAQEMVDRLLILARRGLEESRRAIQSLRTDPVRALGLAEALRDMVQDFQDRTGVQATLRQTGQEPDLTPEEATVLYRIAEEALTNAERHAGAELVTVRLTSETDRVELLLGDDGTGFDLAAADTVGYGLVGMQEQAAMIGAALEVKSQLGGGTEIYCSLER